MRVLLLCNNWVGWQVTRWLQEQNEEIVGLVLHPAHRRKYGEEILQSASLVPERVFEAPQLRETATREAIRALKPDLGISAFFGAILRPLFLEMFPQGVVNIHPALLPYNRGANPNVWSIVEGTPAGVTLHYIDAGLDTGDIISQRQVFVASTETGGSLYQKLELASLELFQETWPRLRTGQAVRIPQLEEGGTAHRLADVAQIDEIDLERSYQARDLINILRARTFPPYHGAYFRDGNKKIYLRLQLDEEITE